MTGASNRRWASPIGAATVVIVVIVGAVVVGLRVDGAAGPGTMATFTGEPPSSALATPQGTGIVARLPIQDGTFAWSPDGAHLLVARRDQYTTSVYDRFGKLVSTFGSIEGWLDSTHLIDGSGYVADIATSHTGGPTANSWVVANGHGSAAIIVAVPACVGDPIIDWYRNGQYVKANEKATPYGWSPDGKLVLLGHMSCSSADAELHGWKGPVDVVDFASDRVVATLPDVRGDMAFNPSATRLAAGSDKDLEILDIATGKVKKVTGARLLGWGDDDRLYCLTIEGSLAAVGATAGIANFGGVVMTWVIASPAGPLVEVDETGRALRIAAVNQKVTLLDLSSAGLVVERYPTSDEHQPSALQPSHWSPDGRMLVLESSDGTSLALISVDPAKAGAIGGAPSPSGS